MHQEIIRTTKDSFQRKKAKKIRKGQHRRHDHIPRPEAPAAFVAELEVVSSFDSAVAQVIAAVSQLPNCEYIQELEDFEQIETVAVDEVAEQTLESPYFTDAVVDLEVTFTTFAYPVLVTIFENPQAYGKYKAWLEAEFTQAQAEWGTQYASFENWLQAIGMVVLLAPSNTKPAKIQSKFTPFTQAA